ncbi:MAG: long-chain acyl-CoA synthetase [Parasphingorhabdus sp.]|jgi:long-chain acyl-CoA synthetase
MREDIWSMISASLQKYENQVAWICRLEKGAERRVSHAELYKAILNMAANLRESGVQKDTVVAVMAPNGPEWCTAALAVWKLGGIVAPVHIGNSQHEIESQMEAIQPKLILTHQRTYSTQDLPIEMISTGPVNEREEELREQFEPNDQALAIYTSGSTGTPKIVRLSHRNMTSNARAGAAFVSLDSNDRFLALLPFSHAMGLTANLMLGLNAGGCLVAPRVLAAKEIVDAMKENQITILVAVPRLFRNIMIGLEKKFASGSPFLRAYIGLIRKSPLFLRRYLNAPIRKNLGGNLKCWLSGGSRLDPEIKQYYLDLGISLRQGYGLTETSPAVAVQEHFDNVMDSVGKPLQDIEIRLVEKNADGSGELQVRGPNIMLGYTDIAYTNEVMDGEWFSTGDLATLDADNRITLTGRKKRLIVTEAGKNIYPDELETLLERDPRIKEAAVLEIDMRAAAILAIEADDPQQIAREVLKSFNALVSTHNRIARFALIEELPRTPLGKIALHKLPQFFQDNEVRKSQ